MAEFFDTGVAGEAVAHEDGFLEGEIVDGNCNQAFRGEAADVDVGG